MSLSVEESNFLRFYFLNLKIAPKAVRIYFDAVHPPSGLANELANCSGTLKGLRFITKPQLKILYPNPAFNVRSEDFDTTLMVCLLRNMTPYECAPRTTGWDNLPLQGDASTGADLARVKWYRNMLAHHEDGKLSSVDFSQYWTDLESAILRLGGPSLHQESQSTQHIVLDTSLTDMLNTVRNCEKDILNLQMSHEKHTSMINELHIKQRSVTEKHETAIQQLQDSLQKSETEAKKLATKFSDTKGAKSIEEIEKCEKEIEKNEERIKVLQEQMVNKQNQIYLLIAQIDKLQIRYDQHDEMLKEHCEQLTKHDGKLAKHDEQLAKHDEHMVILDSQIATHAKNIHDIKKKQQNTDDSSSESTRKRLEDDTKALIEEDLLEGTFVTTVAVTNGLLLLKQNGVLLITGHAGTGKSRISRHILHMFCTEDSSYKCLKLNKLEEWEKMVCIEDNVVILLDDIFGETNCIYNKEKDISILDKVYAYVCKGNIKVMLTIRDTVKRQCQEVFESHRLFKFDFVDLSSDKYKLCEKEKRDILTIYMKKVRQAVLVKFKGFVDQDGIAILEWVEISKITNENPVKGFPLVVYQFVYNNKYFQLGSKFFDRPTEAILEEINDIRRCGENHKRFMILYGVMVYSAINENSIDPDDNSNVTEVVKIIDAIYGETIRMKRCQISDAVKKLEGSYLVKIPNQRSYRYHHPTLLESVILSFAQIDDETMNKIIPLLNWNFLMKMIKPNGYEEKEGEVVLKIATNSYKILAYTLVDIFIAKFTAISYFFLDTLNETGIFQQEDDVLLTYLLEALEKTDHEDNYTAIITRPDDRPSECLYMKNKDVFLSVLLVVLPKKERQFDMFQIVLQMINQIIKTDNNYFTIDCLKAALVTSLYEISSMEDVRSVKHVKALFNIVEENEIPILLDQNFTFISISLPSISLMSLSIYDYYNTDTTCVYISLCILTAYGKFNIPLLEFFLARYQEIPFDVNLFLKVYYGDDREEGFVSLCHELLVTNWKYPVEISSLSNKSLKWLIAKFEHLELNDFDLFLKTSCMCQMLDTVEYLEPKCKTFDAISCLKCCLHLGNVPRHNMKLIYDDDLQRCSKDMFNFLFSKIDKSSTHLTSIFMLILQKQNVPDYICDAFIPVCISSTELLTQACKKAHLYVAKQIMEKNQNVDIQSALLACIPTSYIHKSDDEYLKEERQLKIVKYIIEKFGYEQLDLITLCQQAYLYKKFKIIEWYVKNTDLTLLNVDFIRNSALEQGQLDILEYTINMTELSSFEKNKVLKSITKHYTTVCSTKILEIVSAVWNSTDDKDGLKIEEIIIAAYERKCFLLLMWIYENCNSYISTDVSKLLTLACENGRVEVVKWALQAFESMSQDIDGGLLFMSACDKMLNFNCFEHFELDVVGRINMINWVFQKFQIKPLYLKSGLIRLITVGRNLLDTIEIDGNDVNVFSDLVVSIFEKCVRFLNTKDREEIINKSLDQECYVLVNWVLENDSLCSFDKQNILDKACANDAFTTIKLLSKYFSSLDMKSAMLNACTSYFDEMRLDMSLFKTSDSKIACLDLLWKETDHASIDIRKMVSTVCREKNVCDKVMSWILQNFPLNQIPINKVLIACCKQRKIYHVQYILHEIDSEQLNIKEALCYVCRHFRFRKTYVKVSLNELKLLDVMLVDFLFQRLDDKNSFLSSILKELFFDDSYDILLYFLKKGYCRNIGKKHLMNKACRHGHVRLVQWILGNVKHTQLDIKSAFHEACTCADYTKQLQCVALIWHYIQDVNILGIDSVLKTFNESPYYSTRHEYDGLINWIKYYRILIREG